MSEAAGSRIVAALHVHTLYSACAETKPEAIGDFCRENGIGAIGVTDHDTILGGLALDALHGDIRVIVGEEIHTRQGEIIGLFLTEEIQPGLDALGTCKRIKDQGGLVYIPHPFDPFKIRRLRAQALMEVLDLVDVIEVFNAKLNLPIFNAAASRFALRHGKVGAAGSDAHYLQAIDVCTNEMDDFTTPQEFLESLRHAKLTTKSMYPVRAWWVGIKNALRGEGHRLKRFGRG